MSNFIHNVNCFTRKFLWSLEPCIDGVVTPKSVLTKKPSLTQLSLPLSLIGILGLGSTTAHAGVIFTDQAAFSAAVAGLQLTWSEDFEGFPVGEVVDPLVIGGGRAQYSQKTINISRSNIKDNLGTNHYVESPEDAPPTIEGLADTSLDVRAISFIFGNRLGVSWAFETTLLGTDSSPDFLPSELSPDLFIGWIGITPDENLVSLRAVQPNSFGSVDIDNVEAFIPATTTIPEPASLALLAIGLAGLFINTRKPERLKEL